MRQEIFLESQEKLTHFKRKKLNVYQAVVDLFLTTFS